MTSTRSVLAGTAILAASLLAVTACSSSSASPESTSADGTTPITLQLGWYANPESGGFYAAESQGYLADAGIDLTITPGGPSVAGTQLVASGQAQFGLADAPSIINAQQQGIDIVALGALYQDNPVGVMVHADSGIESFQDMAGKTWATQTGVVQYDWIKKELGIDFQTRAYEGSIAPFLVDDQLVQQGWPTNEVYQAKQAGVDTRFFSFSETGFNPYNDVIFASREFVEANPDLVRSFLDASMKGWVDYLGDVDVATTANDAILAVNSELTPGSAWFAWDAERKYMVSGDAADQLGAMTAERWSTLVDQLDSLGQITEEVDPDTLFDTSYLPEIPAPTTLPDAPEGSF
ncbi:ABC transporter substrate-binding protein [Cnuibacter physcomitrellae]|uniref:ABC transporter substrate-binding protein n=1 Tax=Cnuibacter physcomitrellae TaxID=1619308 RepID=UPI0021759BED|nr:ABC transporter substrate-binding protein [Cnuibacter physcomitrellae]MCS5498413.1 ABC transporter substrate-binding protein [Cnuibacter physcomitrellae]